MVVGKEKPWVVSLVDMLVSLLADKSVEEMVVVKEYCWAEYWVI